MNPNEFTGLQLLQAMADGKLPAPSIAQTMPMSMVHISEGLVRFTSQADERHLNPMGGVHGGFAATMLDSVTACAVHSMLEAGASYATVDLNVKRVKAIPKNTELLAEGKILHISKSIGVSEGNIKSADGTLLAHATATCVIRRQGLLTFHSQLRRAGKRPGTRHATKAITGYFRGT